MKKEQIGHRLEKLSESAASRIGVVKNPGRFPPSLSLSRKYATARRAKPAGAHRTDPSARCRGLQ